MISGALKSLFALSEAYPDLKANQNFLNLQEELTGTEGRIAYARQFYNDTVQRYNTKIQTFPAVVLAGMFHFTPREYFEVDDTARDAVHVSFDTTPAAGNSDGSGHPARAASANRTSCAAAAAVVRNPLCTTRSPPTSGALRCSSRHSSCWRCSSPSR